MGLHPILLRERLWDAIYDNRLDRIRQLIDEGADVNLRTPGGGSLLCHAAGHGRPEALRLLIEAGADVNASESDGDVSPLLAAIVEKKAKSAEVLIDAGADVNFTARTLRTTPLIEAVRAKRVGLVKRLIAHGADVNYAGREEMTPLAMARRRNAPKSILDALLAAGAADAPRAVVDPACTRGRAARNVEKSTESIEQRQRECGVATFEYENSAVFVDAGVEEVASTLADLHGTVAWQKNVQGGTIELPRHGCLVFRRNGDRWSIVVHREVHTDSKRAAQALSQRLNTIAVAYHVSNIRAALSYSLYEDGQPLEHLTDKGGELSFSSSLRELESRQVAADVFALVDRVFREQGICEPGLGFAQLIEQDKPRESCQAGETVQIAARQDIQRVDLLALPGDYDGVADNPVAGIAEHLDAWKRQIRGPKAFRDANIRAERSGESSRMRGLRTVEHDNVSLLVKAPIAEVTKAVMKRRKLAHCRHDILGDPPIEIDVSGGVFVFQLNGQSWSVIVDGSLHHDYERLARSLSDILDTETICLALRGSVGGVILRWFSNGCQLERFHSFTGVPKAFDLVRAFKTDCLAPLDPTDTCVSTQVDPMDAGDGEYRSGTLQSRARRLKTTNPDTVEAFVDEGLRMADAYEPGVTFADLAALVAGKRPRKGFPWHKTDFARADYIGPK